MPKSPPRRPHPRAFRVLAGGCGEGDADFRRCLLDVSGDIEGVAGKGLRTRRAGALPCTRRWRSRRSPGRLQHGVADSRLGTERFGEQERIVEGGGNLASGHAPGAKARRLRVLRAPLPGGRQPGTDHRRQALGRASGPRVGDEDRKNPLGELGRAVFCDLREAMVERRIGQPDAKSWPSRRRRRGQSGPERSRH